MSVREPEELMDEAWPVIKPLALDFLAAVAEEIEKQMGGRIKAGHPVEVTLGPATVHLVMPIKRVRKAVSIIFDFYIQHYQMPSYNIMLDYSQKPDDRTPIEEDLKISTLDQVIFTIKEWTELAEAFAKVILPRLKVIMGPKDWVPPER